MRVAAELRVETGARRPRQVRGHDGGGAAVERERRRQHPAVTERHQLGQSRLRLFLEQVDRVTTGRSRLPRGVHLARHLRPRRLAPRDTLRNAEMLDLTGRPRRRPSNLLALNSAHLESPLQRSALS